MNQSGRFVNCSRLGSRCRRIGGRAVLLDYEYLILSSVSDCIGTPVAQAIHALGDWLIAVNMFDEHCGPAKPTR